MALILAASLSFAAVAVSLYSLAWAAQSAVSSSPAALASAIGPLVSDWKDRRFDCSDQSAKAPTASSTATRHNGAVSTFQRSFRSSNRSVMSVSSLGRKKWRH